MGHNSGCDSLGETGVKGGSPLGNGEGSVTPFLVGSGEAITSTW